ncbi:MAG: C1 family peptidase, partial [Scardovia wiggsiae]
MAVISSEDTLKMKEAFSQDKKNILAQRASATNGLLKAAEDPFVIARNRNPYSTDLVSDEVTNQKHSGRCWMFAGLNVLRFHLEKKLNVENFELSQNFLYFYDKLEKSNYFYENVIA